ncbi:MAG TPA: glycosyltransferase family 4 protein [Cellvibrionaceae bacterium]|nr:glycosyltransferase family 4 protein [Cellvibrionaceae bacterium]
MNAHHTDTKPSLLLVANWDSNVGYAWWLMESYWARICRQYSDRYQIILAFPSISTIPDHLQLDDLNCVEFPFAQEWGVSFIQRAQFILRHRIKVIYLTDHPTFALSYLLYRCLGVRWVITHDHSPGQRNAPSGFKKIIKSLCNRLRWLSADACIGATDYVKERLQRVNCVPQAKCFAAPNGIVLRPLGGDKQALRKRFGFDTASQIVVTVARANKYKGIDFALDVFALIAKAHPELNFTYLMVGDGPHLAEFKQRAVQLGLSERVVFLGRVESVDDYLLACDLAFHPSLGEVGYCLAILEYMQANLPVVVPDNPSVCGATSPATGVIYPEFNLASAAEALTTLMQQPLLSAQKGQAGRQMVEEQFSLAKSHQALINVFDTMMR